MEGSNAQIRANQEQARRYRLSGDTIGVIRLRPSTDIPGGLAVPIWQHIVVKYLEDVRKRSILGALGNMAGYEVK